MSVKPAYLAASAEVAECAAACVGLDGRAIRKLVANALAGDQQTAIDPGRLAMPALLAAARAAHEVRTKRVSAKGGRA